MRVALNANATLFSRFPASHFIVCLYKAQRMWCKEPTGSVGGGRHIHIHPTQASWYWVFSIHLQKALSFEAWDKHNYTLLTSNCKMCQEGWWAVPTVANLTTKYTCVWKAGPNWVCWGRQSCWGNLLLHTQTSRWWGKARLRETKPTKTVWLMWAGSSKSHRSSVKQPRDAWCKAEDDGVKLGYALWTCALVNKREQSWNESESAISLARVQEGKRIIFQPDCVRLTLGTWTTVSAAFVKRKQSRREKKWSLVKRGTKRDTRSPK